MPDEATIERLDPLVDGERVLEVRDRTQTTSVLGRGAPKGTFFDYAPLHVVTIATLRRLQDLTPGSQFDAARFRPNVVLDLPSGGAFTENAWGGALLHIGGDIVLQVERPTPRCAVPTLAQPDLPEDLEIIRAIARHNCIAMEGIGRASCVGAYAQIVQGGAIRVGDAVHVERTAA